VKNEYRLVLISFVVMTLFVW